MSSQDKEAFNVSSTEAWDVLKKQYTSRFIDRLMIASGNARRTYFASCQDLADSHKEVFQYRLKTGTNSDSTASKKEWGKQSASAWTRCAVIIDDLEAKILKMTDTTTGHSEERGAELAGDISETPYGLEEQAEILGEFSAQVTIIDDAINAMS